MFAEACRDPRDGEALDITVTAHDLERRGGKPHIGQVGIFQADVGLINLAVITRNGMAQFMDAD